MLTQIGNPSTFRNLVVVVRAQVAQIEGGGLGHAPRRVLSTGWHSIDVALPGGGLVQGALHEMAGSGPDIEHGTTPAALIAGIAARACGQVIWIVERVPPHGPGLAGFGLAPDRVIYVVAGKNVLLAMEDSLRQAGLIAVVGEVSGRLGLTTSRRLQLVAEASGVIAFALRRSHVHDDPMLAEPSAAMTRWRVAVLPSPAAMARAPHVAGIGRGCWQLDLVRCRDGAPAFWIIQGCDAQGHLHPVVGLDGHAASTDPIWRASG